MNVKLLTDHLLEFLSLKEAVEARPSHHLSKCHIVGNLMPWLMLIEVMQLIYICLEASCTVVDVFVVSVKTSTNYMCVYGNTNLPYFR